MFIQLIHSDYKKWVFESYNSKSAQDYLRDSYQDALQGFKLLEIKNGLREWASVNGVDNPPTPGVFKKFLDSKRRLAKAKIKQLREVLHG